MNRKGLLTIGMGLALFAAAATAVNVLALPFARTLYGYGAAIQWIVCALAAGWKEGRLCKALTRIAGKPCVR